MKLLLLSVGKPHELYVKSGITDFSQRINNYFKADWQIISAPKNAAKLSEDDLKKAEAEFSIKIVSKENFLPSNDVKIDELPEGEK